MKASTFFPLLAGLAAAVIAFSAWIKAGGRSKDDVETGPVRTVVLAKADIPYSARITDDLLATVQYKGTRFPVAETFGKTEDLVGRVASAKIVAGAPVTEPMLAPPGTPPGAIHQIPLGYRPVPVNIQSYAVRHLEPGCRVDVFTTIRNVGARSQGRPSELILQNIQVFAVGSRLLGMDPVEERVDSVELLVPADRVAALYEAVTAGGIHLVMRGATDQELVEIPVARPPQPEETVVVAEPEPEPPRAPQVETLTVKVYNGPEERTREYQRPAPPLRADSD